MIGLTMADRKAEAAEDEAERNADQRREAEADADALQRGQDVPADALVVRPVAVERVGEQRDAASQVWPGRECCRPSWWRRTRCRSGSACRGRAAGPHGRRPSEFSPIGVPTAQAALFSIFFSLAGSATTSATGLLVVMLCPKGTSFGARSMGFFAKWPFIVMARHVVSFSFAVAGARGPID
jgi:hypothetical protein